MRWVSGKELNEGSYNGILNMCEFPRFGLGLRHYLRVNNPWQLIRPAVQGAWHICCSLQSSQFEIKFPLTTWTSSLLPSTSDLTAHQTSFQSSLYIPFPAVSHDQLCWMNCAWVKLTFIIVVRLALCFGFVTKTDLITHWCLSVVAEQCLHIVKAFSVSHSPYQQVGWGFTRS